MHIKLANGLILAFMSTAAYAQSSTANERIVRGKAFLTENCKNEGMFNEQIYGAGDAQEPEELAGFGGLLTSTVAELGGAAIGLLGDALKKAAQAKAYGVESTFSYPFYGGEWIGGEDYSFGLTGAKKDYSKPTVGCINLMAVTQHFNLPPYEITDPRIESNYVEYEVRGTEPPQANFKVEPYDFAMEIAMIDQGDALELRPVHINYRTHIDKFPKKRLPSEVQLVFSKPSAKGDDSFAVVRMPLQPVQSGDVWWDYQLNYTGIRIPLRPDGDGKATGAHGSTNVTVRFVMYRDENKFLKSVGEILAGKKDDVDKLITTELSTKPQWSEAMASYQLGKLELRHAEEDLTAAQQTKDAEKIRKAETEVLKAKAKINAAAGQIGISPPYPIEN